MDEIKKELRKIIEYNNTQFLENERKSQEELENITEDIYSKLINNDFNFAKFEVHTITQNHKKRKVYKYDDWSVEHFLCIYIKRCLDGKFHIKYSNRNEHMHLLFSTLSSITDMRDYVIVKFDFEDFFESINSEYVYRKCIQNISLSRFQQDLLNIFVKQCKICYAGINTSNILSEIISQQFDKMILKKFSDKGLIFYKRYVDDGILIFNKYIKKDDVYKIIESSISATYNDRCIGMDLNCSTKINQNKFSYISMRNLGSEGCAFNYLGYNFILSTKNNKKTIIEYGITQEKINKYTKKINKIVNDYIKNKNIELLRHRIRAFACRTVYRRKKYSSLIWKSKGFISNYCELSFHMDSLDKNTIEFLKNGISDVFKANNIKPPYFINTNPYSLYCCLKNKTTLLFEENERVGINFDTLKKMCKEIGIQITDEKTYNSLVREYLIAVKIGH